MREKSVTFIMLSLLCRHLERCQHNSDKTQLCYSLVTGDKTLSLLCHPCRWVVIEALMPKWFFIVECFFSPPTYIFHLLFCLVKIWNTLGLKFKSKNLESPLPLLLNKMVSFTLGAFSFCWASSSICFSFKLRISFSNSQNCFFCSVFTLRCDVSQCQCYHCSWQNWEKNHWIIKRITIELSKYAHRYDVLPYWS